jgi:hypothetical protein
VVILELCAQFFGRKPLSEQTTEGFERFGATPTRAVADREQDFDAWLIKLADAYVRFATKHSALIGLMFAAKH